MASSPLMNASATESRDDIAADGTGERKARTA
jgi:hypothetical protein